jgi:hypothetical protein
VRTADHLPQTLQYPPPPLQATELLAVPSEAELLGLSADMGLLSPCSAAAKPAAGLPPCGAAGPPAHAARWGPPTSSWPLMPY